MAMSLINLMQNLGVGSNSKKMKSPMTGQMVSPSREVMNRIVKTMNLDDIPLSWRRMMKKERIRYIQDPDMVCGKPDDDDMLVERK